ncbi:hypothetical protein AM233_20100 [Bacillus sp. FJAT-22058]|nr:hypothetical protein AM233_20100 [Bacillus sp. FJAT-22058]
MYFTVFLIRLGLIKGRVCLFVFRKGERSHVGRGENFRLQPVLQKKPSFFGMPQFRIEPFELKIRQDPHRKVNAY